MPVGTMEQHGPHLPLMTDFCIATEVARRAIEQVPDEALLMPTIYYGFNEHHMDFPGTIAIDGHHFVDYVADVGKSLAHHGFRKIILVNGHGSNVPFLDAAARAVTNSTPAVCAMVPWWTLAASAAREIRESERPGGICHGGEAETSAMLYLRGEMVRFEKAKKEIGFQKSRYIHWDLLDKPPVTFMEWWSRFSKSGVVGDPTLATREKGEKLVETAANELAEFIKEFRRRKIADRVDHH